MNAHARRFTAELAVREQVPLLIGLMGPSGGGKTFSALRLATGIQSICGGEIFGIDTEAKRMKHYADDFKFRHVPFSEPFGSYDYLEALKYCVSQGASVVIVDSMSHEHEGVGGLLDFHERELDRMAGDNYSKREAMKMLAWGKPKAARRALINGLLQMNCNFIFCFRAKQSVKPVKINGKTEVVPQGFMPIAGEEFVFEMTTNALLLPGAGGVPTWQSENVGEKVMIKAAGQFARIFREPRPLDEEHGRALALWARGEKPAGDQGRGPTDQRQESDFPGDRTRPAAPTQNLPLSERVALFKQRVAAAPSLVKLNSINAASPNLRDDVDRAAPELLIDMDEALEARRTELEEAERMGGAA